MYWMKQAQISKYHQVPNYMISDSKPPNLEGVFFNNNKKTPLIGSITNKKTFESKCRPKYKHALKKYSIFRYF